MKKVKLFEQFIAEKREKVGEYNTVKKVVAELGRRPSEQDLASFINDNYYDVTEVERGEDDPRANDKIADLVAFYKFDIDDWEIAWEDAQNESVVVEGKLKISGPAYDFWDDRDVQRKLKGVKIKIVGDIGGVLTISGADDEIQKVKDILGLNESVVSEAVSRATKIYQIATPAPKAMLVEELEDLFGDDYRHIVTEFDDDERYESVLVFNLTPRDIKRIQEEIADVLIWEYSIKKGKEISESAMIEALSKSDRKAIAYTMAEQDPTKIKDLQKAIGKDFSDNYSSTLRSILVDVKKKGGKWVAITKEAPSKYNNKKPKKGEREATIGITWNAMFF